VTALITFSPGDDPTAAQWQTLRSIGAVKTANENRISTSTMADDAALRADYNTNATYRMSGLIIHNSSTAADFKFQIADTGSVTLAKFSVLGVAVGGSTEIKQEGGIGFGFTGEGAGADRSLWITGVVIVGGTPGALKIQWAQNTSTASTTSVQAASFLILDQVA